VTWRIFDRLAWAWEQVQRWWIEGRDTSGVREVYELEARNGDVREKSQFARQQSGQACAEAP
jgi:hypothetical protein